MVITGCNIIFMFIFRKPRVYRAVSSDAGLAETQHSAAFHTQHQWDCIVQTLHSVDTSCNQPQAVSSLHTTTHTPIKLVTSWRNIRSPPYPFTGPPGTDTPDVLYTSHKVVPSVLRFKNPCTDWNQSVTGRIQNVELQGRNQVGKASSRIPLNKRHA